MRDEFAEPLGVGSIDFMVLLARFDHPRRTAHRDFPLQGEIRDDEQTRDDGDQDASRSHGQAWPTHYRPNHGSEEPDWADQGRESVATTVNHVEEDNN